MFSVYGRAGRVFNGSLEEMQQVGAVSRLRRLRQGVTQGLSRQEDEPSDFAELLSSQPRDLAHRSALEAYAQTRRPDPQRQPITQVHSLMSSKVLTIADTATVEQAWRLLSQNQFGQAPVVTADGTLVGLLGRAEMLRADHLPGPDSHALAWRALLMQSVTELMWTPVPSVTADADIRRVARVLLDTGLPGLPVVDEAGQVVGFISRSDILRAVVSDPPLDLWT